MTDTWNNGATTFTAIKMDVTDTASAAASLLMDLQVGGTSQIKISKGGIIQSQSNSVVGTNILSTYMEMYVSTATLIASQSAIGGSGVLGRALRYDASSTPSWVMAANTSFGWSATNAAAGSDAAASADTILVRDAANTLALRNSTSKQTFNLYNTYTNASNNAGIAISNNSNGQFYLSIFSNGTGSSAIANDFNIYHGGNAAINFYTNATLKWVMNGSGHLLAGTDNTNDIGASGATRPRIIYPGMVVKYASLTLTSLSASIIGAASAGAGAMAYISDGNVPVVFTTVAGGGTTPCPVYSDGTQWRAG